MCEHSVNEHDLEWQENAQPGFNSRLKLLSRRAKCKQLGCNLVEVPPGNAAWPFHYHCAAEEAIYILSGQGTMRIGKNSYEAAAGDYFALLPGLEDTAHQLRNTSQDTLRYLVMGIAPETRVDICGYPDSNKLRFSYRPLEGPSRMRTIDNDTPDLEYYHGES